ncbi:MAG: Ig-like domain-containing protein [Polyangiaceae bacterium]
MRDGAATWLKRVLGLTQVLVLSTALGCGDVTRNFGPDTPGDASSDGVVDDVTPKNDVTPGMDTRVDMSTPMDAGPDADVTLDVTVDNRDAADAPLDRTNEGGPDVTLPDIVVTDVPPGDSADVSNSPPTIVDTIPAHSATAVAVTTTVTVNFSKAMNPSSVTLSIAPSVPLGTAIWNPDYTSIAFSPPSAFAASTMYTVTVTGQDTAGRALTGTNSFAFTTGAGADTTAPQITSTTPANNATGVAASSAITIVFSEPMDVGSIVVTPVPDIPLGVAVFNTQNTQVTFTPTTALTPSTLYTLTVAGQDPARNKLPSSAGFAFTTAQPPVTTPPTVVSVAPPAGATGVPSNSSLVITFSEAMNIGATTNAISVSPAITCTGGWSWNVAQTTTTCVPTTPLAYTTTYTVSVSAAAVDLANNALTAYSSTFTTGVAPDTTPPTIVSTTPQNRASGISRLAKISVTFSEAMDVTNTQAAFVITSPAGITGTIAWSSGNTVMTFTPSVQYPYGSDVTWTVSTAARDAAGNPKASDDNFIFSVIKQTTVDLPCIGSLDGFVNNTPAAYTGSSITMGYSSWTLRGMAAFDITQLPANATLISSATIYLKQYSVAGTPYGSTRLGNVLWRHVDYGPSLDAADFDTPLLTHTGATNGTLSTTATFEWKSAIVTFSVRDDFTNRTTRANRSEYQIRFTNDTVTPVTTEYAYFYSCEAVAPADRPYISVTYESP